MRDLLDKLDPRQREIVQDTEGQVLVLSGAGSGKTRVLTYRIAYLIENGVPPWAILAVTFTNKAKRVMEERIQELVGDQGNEVWMGTFHSICIRILRRFGGQIGLAPNFTIIDDKERTKILKDAIEKAECQYEPEVMASIIGNAKNDLLTPAELRMNASNRYERDAAYVYEIYEEKKDKSGYVDFDDMIMKTVRLLQNSTEARDLYQKQFRYILADEGQDTNTAQYTLLNLLMGEHQNLFVVGDIDQSVYRWRGAKIENMIKFQEVYPESRIHQLDQNYRSTANIVNAANAVIEHNVERLEKTAWTSKEAGPPIVLYEAEDDSREAEFVVSAIQRMVDVEGQSYNNFAILYRMGRQSRLIEVALTQAGIPYKVVGGKSFYDRKEIKDLVAYLRIIANEFDALAMERIINVPKRGIGDTTVKKIDQYAKDCSIPFPKALEYIDDIPKISKGTKLKIENFDHFILSLREFACVPGVSIPEIIQHILSQTGYLTELDPDKEEDESRIGNIRELIKVAEEWENTTSNPGCISDFLSETTLSGIEEGEEEVDSVTLMTAHSSKGLEFPCVFMVGMEENIFPHSRSSNDPKNMEEERRLAYVAITRAEYRLFITYCFNRYEYGDPRPKRSKVSRFVLEIPSELVRKIG
jgi:DNA helicase-2/ATP-dependent DNA helicase PcrA